MTKSQRAGAQALATLVLLGALCGLASRVGDARQICAQARSEHRLIYPMTRCIIAETINPEDR